MVVLEEIWWEGYQVCLLKDSSHPHRMALTLAPVHQDKGTRRERTLEEEGLNLGHLSHSSNSSSLT